MDILRMNKMRWAGVGEIRSAHYSIIYSDREKHERGIYMILCNKGKERFLKYIRILLVQLKRKPININMIQLYAITTDGSEEDIQEVYNQLEQAVETIQNT